MPLVGVQTRVTSRVHKIGGARGEWICNWPLHPGDNLFPPQTRSDTCRLNLTVSSQEMALSRRIVSIAFGLLFIFTGMFSNSYIYFEFEGQH